MKSPRIPCPTCGGVGQITLPTPLLDTLVILSARTWTSTKQVYAALKDESIGQSAVSNRLAALHELRLAYFTRLGKEKLWKKTLA